MTKVAVLWSDSSVQQHTLDSYMKCAKLIDAIAQRLSFVRPRTAFELQAQTPIQKDCARLPINYPKQNAQSCTYYAAVKASVGQSVESNVANGLHVCLLVFRILYLCLKNWMCSKGNKSAIFCLCKFFFAACIHKNNNFRTSKIKTLGQAVFKTSLVTNTKESRFPISILIYA